MAYQIRVRIVEEYVRIFTSDELADLLGEPHQPPELIAEAAEAVLKDGHVEGADRVLNALVAEENSAGYTFEVEEY